MKHYLLIITMLLGLQGHSQEYVLDSVMPIYEELIHTEANKLLGAETSPYFNHFSLFASIL